MKIRNAKNCEDILKRQSERIEKEILKVKESTQGRVGQVFKMKENIMGHKKAGTEPHAIKDPVTGELLVANEDIKKATLAYCVENLKKKNGSDSGRDSLINVKKSLIESKFRDAEKEPLKISKGDFRVVVEKFKSKQTKSYDFLIRSDEKYQDAIFKLSKRMIENEEFPTQFSNTLLYMIWKSKGPQEVLKNNRFIHTKNS